GAPPAPACRHRSLAPQVRDGPPARRVRDFRSRRLIGRFDGPCLYWTNSNNDGAVMRASKDGANLSIVANGLHGSSGLAVDVTSAFWTTYIDGFVMKAEK